MEASFKSRVDMAFGNLVGACVNSSSSAKIALPNLDGWTVSENPICKRRDSRGIESSGSESDEPCDDSEDEKHAGRRPAKRRNFNEGQDVLQATAQEEISEEEECRQMRLMVGMDETLDFEEEEDEYDKVAVGREGKGERMYMKEVRASGPAMGQVTPLPVSVDGLMHFTRDARANHSAAAARLMEDAQQAGALSNDEKVVGEVDVCDVVPLQIDSEDLEKVDCTEGKKVPFTEGKGILSKHSGAVKRLGKGDRKVKFAENEVTDKEPTFDEVKRKSLALPGRSNRVPDHVKNPSKYTHYTLDWSDDGNDDKRNLAAFQATRAIAIAQSTLDHSEKEVVSSAESTKSITFIPRLGRNSNKARIEEKVGPQQSQNLVSFSVELGASENGAGGDEAAVTFLQQTVKSARVFRKRGTRENPESDSEIS